MQVWRWLRVDIVAVYERTHPAIAAAFLYFRPSFSLSHCPLAVAGAMIWHMFQMRISEMFGVDIHPGAKMDKGS